VEPIYALHQTPEYLELYELHSNFISYIKSIGIRTTTIEGIYPNQTFQLTKSNNNNTEFQVKLDVPFYIRENLINVVAKRLIDTWEYLMWIDGHQWFLNPFWWEEAIYKMEKYSSV
jgi:hypothetical protein